MKTLMWHNESPRDFVMETEATSSDVIELLNSNIPIPCNLKWKNTVIRFATLRDRRFFREALELAFKD